MPYPVTNSPQDIVDGLNYALSGPGGLGQDFAWFNSNGLTQYDLTGNFRAPYATESFGSPGVPTINISVDPIALGTSEMLDERTWKYTFATPVVGAAPFIPGQPITVSGVTDPYYDNTFVPIGVIECTTAYVVARTNGSFPVVANSTGGTVELTSMDFLTSTDCLARITVIGDSQPVILSSQLNAELFVKPGTTGSFYYKVSINRYVAIPNNDPTNPDFVFIPDDEPGRPPATIAYKEYLIPVTSPYVPEKVETIFTSIIDQPGNGYYQYILEVEFNDNSGGNVVTNVLLTQRSFSAQAFKP